MKTKRFRLLTVLLTTVMLVTLSLNVMAAKSSAVTQDGLTAQLVTDKDSYKAGESVKASVQVKNHTGREVFIFTQINVPEGVKLASESTTFDTRLQDGETWTTPGGITLLATDVAAGTTATGDNMQAGFWIVLIVLAVAGIIALFVYGKNKQTWLSIMLCMAMVAGMAVAALPARAADMNADIQLSCTIQVDSKDTELSAIVSYVIYDEAEDVVEEAVTTPTEAPTEEPTATQEPTATEAPTEAPTEEPTPGEEEGFTFTQSILDESVAALMSSSRVGCSLGTTTASQKESNALYYVTLAANLNEKAVASDGTLCTDAVKSYIEFFLAGGNEPAAYVNCFWDHAMYASAMLLIKNTEIIYSELSQDTIDRMDWLMKALAIAGNWGFNDANDYYTGISLQGNFNKYYNPNYKNTYLSIVLTAAMYFGNQELDEIFVNFDYDTYIAKYEELGFSNIVSAWTKAGKTTAKALMETGVDENGNNPVLLAGNNAQSGSIGKPDSGGTGKGVKIPFKLNGKGLDGLAGLENIITYLINDTYAAQSVTKSGEGENITYEVTVKDLLVLSEREFDNGMKYYMLSGAKSPYEGQSGMHVELALSNRSHIGYSFHNFELLTAVVANLKHLGYWDDFSDGTETLWSRMYVGNMDLLFKAGEGWYGFKSTTQSKQYGYEYNSRGLAYSMDVWYKYLLGYEEDTVLFVEPETEKAPEGTWPGISDINEAFYPIGAELTNGTVSFDVTMGSYITPSDYDACILLEPKRENIVWASANMLIQFQKGNVNVYNNKGYMFTGLTFAAGDTFHVEMDFDVPSETYVVRIQKTSSEEGTVYETATYQFRATGDAINFVDSLIVVKNKIDSTLWVDNFEIKSISTVVPELDTTAPVITGIEDGKTYCVAPTMTITDNELASVTINGEEITLNADDTYNFLPEAGNQEIVATDRSGNKTTCTIWVTAVATVDNMIVGEEAVSNTLTSESSSTKRVSVFSAQDGADLTTYSKLTFSMKVDPPAGKEAGTKTVSVVFSCPRNSEGKTRYFNKGLTVQTDGEWHDYTVTLSTVSGTRSPSWNEVTAIGIGGPSGYYSGNLDEGTVVSVKNAVLVAAASGERVHTFEQKIEDAKYQASVGVYYMSCVCGEAGTETFTVENHTHTYQEVVDAKYLVDVSAVATCTAGVKYYKSCACGARSEETFEGDKDAENHTTECTYTLNTSNDIYHDKTYSCCNTTTTEAHVQNTEEPTKCALCKEAYKEVVKKQYTVTFKDYTGVELTDYALTQVEETEYTMPAGPARTDEGTEAKKYAYEFAGWKSDAGETVAAGASVKATADVTYTATYAKILFMTTGDDLAVDTDADGNKTPKAVDISEATVNDFTNIEISGSANNKPYVSIHVVDNNGDKEIKTYSKNGIEKEDIMMYLDRDIDMSWLDNLTIEFTVSVSGTASNNVKSDGYLTYYDVASSEWKTVTASDSNVVLYNTISDKGVEHNIKIELTRVDENGNWTSTYYKNNEAKDGYTGLALTLPNEEKMRFRFRTYFKSSSTRSVIYDNIKIYTTNTEASSSQTPEKAEYTVNFVDYAGNALNGDSYNLTLEEGTVITVPDGPEREADAANTYTFDCWKAYNPETQETGEVIAEGATATANVTYIATYTATPIVSQEEVPTLTVVLANGKTGDTVYTNDIKVNITARGELSDVTGISYYYTKNVDAVMSEDELKAIADTQWTNTIITTSGKEAIATGMESIAKDGTADGNYIIYVKAVNAQGNVAYANLGKIVYDTIKPVITMDEGAWDATDEVYYAVASGQTVTEPVTMTVTETNLKSVSSKDVDEKDITVTASESAGSYVLTPCWYAQTITATDEAGNVSEPITVKVHTKYNIGSPSLIGSGDNARLSFTCSGVTNYQELKFDVTMTATDNTIESGSDVKFEVKFGTSTTKYVMYYPVVKEGQKQTIILDLVAGGSVTTGKDRSEILASATDFKVYLTKNGGSADLTKYTRKFENIYFIGPAASVSAE